MNGITVEVCVDNLQSLETAIDAGADRIELCSSLLLGGITPTYGLTTISVNAQIPIYAMVRPRSGDFLFSNNEIAMMCDEIQFFRDVGVEGVVIGALTQNAEINVQTVRKWVNSAGNMGITFHRAFDLVADPIKSMETLIDLGCQRILTSGGCATAFEGISRIKELVSKANNRISIMPGCGVNNTNVKHIIESTGATEIHLSGKKSVPSLMKRSKHSATMGSNSENDNFLEVTDFHIIKDVVTQLNEN